MQCPQFHSSFQFMIDDGWMDLCTRLMTPFNTSATLCHPEGMVMWLCTYADQRFSYIIFSFLLVAAHLQDFTGNGRILTSHRHQVSRYTPRERFSKCEDYGTESMPDYSRKFKDRSNLAKGIIQQEKATQKEQTKRCGMRRKNPVKFIINSFSLFACFSVSSHT